MSGVSVQVSGFGQIITTSESPFFAPQREINQLLSSFGRRCVVTAVILLSLCLIPQASFAGFCASQTDPSVVYCEDFSGTNPLTNYTVTNPWGSGPGFKSIGISNQQLAWVNNPAGGALASVIYNRQNLNVANTSLEADVQFVTSAALRSNMGIGLFGDTSYPGVRIQLGLQLDDQRAALSVVNDFGGINNTVSNGYPLAPNQTYRIRLEIEGATRVRGYIDGSLVVDVQQDLSSFPAQMFPGFVGNAYGWYPETQLYSNVIARHKINLSCQGFTPPLNKGPVVVRGNRTLPFKAQLVDANGVVFTNVQLGTTPPVINVNFDAGTKGAPEAFTHTAAPPSPGADGNQFVFADGVWQYHLKTASFTAPGTYYVTMASGGPYTINPTCRGAFIRLERDGGSN
jgi:hypothetical protein